MAAVTVRAEGNLTNTIPKSNRRRVVGVILFVTIALCFLAIKGNWMMGAIGSDRSYDDSIEAKAQLIRGKELAQQLGLKDLSISSRSVYVICVLKNNSGRTAYVTFTVSVNNGNWIHSNTYDVSVFAPNDKARIAINLFDYAAPEEVPNFESIVPSVRIRKLTLK